MPPESLRTRPQMSLDHGSATMRPQRDVRGRTILRGKKPLDIDGIRTGTGPPRFSRPPTFAARRCTRQVHGACQVHAQLLCDAGGHPNASRCRTARRGHRLAALSRARPPRPYTSPRSSSQSQQPDTRQARADLAKIAYLAGPGAMPQRLFDLFPRRSWHRSSARPSRHRAAVCAVVRWNACTDGIAQVRVGLPARRHGADRAERCSCGLHAVNPVCIAFSRT